MKYMADKCGMFFKKLSKKFFKYSGDHCYVCGSPDSVVVGKYSCCFNCVERYGKGILHDT
ncbi:MAG: hypothetical protein GY853_16335 [PVC group bacterium]|nr:hypothetical protein [PVC group bacterium]